MLCTVYVHTLWQKDSTTATQAQYSEASLFRYGRKTSSVKSFILAKPGIKLFSAVSYAFS
jgi:hypothetical protein